MHIIFTEEEKEYIEQKPFNWQIKENCPENIKKTLIKKLNLLKEVSNESKRI